MRQSCLLVFGLALFACGVGGRAASQPAAAAYADGVVAFEAGDYPQALDAFLKARDAGYAGPQLGYSLGSTYYQLGRYDAARREFQALLSDPDLAGLCRYNLGLIDLKQGDPEAARSDFSAAVAEVREPAIKQLAAGALARLPPPPVAHRWFGYVNMGAGYDDDVAPVSQAGLVPPSRQGSSFVSLLAGGSGQLTGSYADGLQLAGSLYRADYLQLSHFDETYLSLGPEYRRGDGAWETSVGLSASHVILGSESLESSGLLELDESWAVTGEDKLKGGYEYEHVIGGSGFDYLSGSRQALSVEGIHTELAYALTLGYQHEINRRHDLSVPPEFFSDSPTQNRYYGRLKLRLTDRLSSEFGLSYENNLYSQPDVITTANAVTAVTRHDDLYYATAAAKYQIAPNWSLGAEYRYLRNDSNIPSYAYQSHRITLSLALLFF